MLSDSTRDTLTSLSVVSNALGQLAFAAATNANSDDLSDPSMNAVRKQFLNVVSMGKTILSIDRPNALRATYAQIDAWLNGEVDAETITRAIKDEAMSKFTAGKSYSAAQIGSRLFTAGIDSTDINASLPPVLA